MVVASARSVSQRVSPSAVEPITAEPGEDVGFERLIRDLALAGYHRSDRVEARGEVAVRGGIIDVFPAQGDEPVRIELWGDEVDSIRVLRHLEPAVDRAGPWAGGLPSTGVSSGGSGGKMRRAACSTPSHGPPPPGSASPKELVFPGMESWLPWITPPVTVLDELPPGARLVVFDPVRAGDRSRDLVKEEAGLRSGAGPDVGSRRSRGWRAPLPVPRSRPVARGPRSAGCPTAGGRTER